MSIKRAAALVAVSFSISLLICLWVGQAILAKQEINKVYDVCLNSHYLTLNDVQFECYPIDPVAPKMYLFKEGIKP